MLQRMVAIGLLIGAVASLGLTAGPAFSEDSGVLNATVTVGTPCLIVPSTTVDYGTKPFANTSTGDSIATGAQFAVESCSAAPQNLFAGGNVMFHGTVPTWTLGWDSSLPTCYQEGLGGPVTLDVYRHELVASPGDRTVVLGLGLSGVGTMSALGEVWNFTPKLYMPCSGSAGVGQTMNTTITFTAYY